MNELKISISEIEKLFNENIKDKYAKLYEESEIAEKDTLVINKLSECINSVNTFKNNCTGCREYSDTYHYNNTSENLSTLISSIDGYALICNNIVENIEKASKKAYQEVYSDFSLKLMDFDRLIYLANQYYGKASSALRRRNKYTNDDPEYHTWNNKYSTYKRKCQDHIANLKDRYNKLIDYINNEGIKKVGTSSIQVPNSDTIGSESSTSTSTSSSVQYGSGISREFDYSENGNLEAVTTINDNLGKITTRYDETGLPISHTIYNKNGNKIATFEFDEDGDMKAIASDGFDYQNGFIIDKNTGQEYFAGAGNKGEFEFILYDDKIKNRYDEYGENSIEGLYAYDLSGENRRIGFSTDINFEGDVISTLIDGNGESEQSVVDKYGTIVDENYSRTTDANGLEIIKTSDSKYTYNTNDDSYRRVESNNYVIEENQYSSYRYNHEEPNGSIINLDVTLKSNGSSINFQCVEPNPEIDQERGYSSGYINYVKDDKTGETYSFSTEYNWFEKFNIDGVKDFDSDTLQDIVSNAKELDSLEKRLQ